MTIRIGALRHRIVFDERVEAQNSAGEPIPNWTPRVKVWASVEPLSGREVLLTDKITETMDTRIRVRWSPTIERMDAKWRIRHQDTVYNIVSIAHLEFGRHEIEIMARTGANDG